jgi:hypothetical protein
LHDPTKGRFENSTNKTQLIAITLGRYKNN